MGEEKGKGYVPAFYVKTPSLMLNQHLKHGGIPSGAILQIQSDGAGYFKTSFAVQMMAEAQRTLGCDVAYIDAEGALNNDVNDDGTQTNKWLEDLGLDMKNTWFQSPDTGEVIWEKVIDYIENKNCKVIVIDSIHAVQPSKLHEAKMGDHMIGTHATLHKVGLLKVMSLLQKHNVILIGINHLKVNMTKMGAMGKKATGGSAWESYSQFIFINGRDSARSLDGETIIPLDIYVYKSKGGSSFFNVETFARQGYGIDQTYELIPLAKAKGLVKETKGWFEVFDNPKKIRMEEAVEWCILNKELIIG